MGETVEEQAKRYADMGLDNFTGYKLPPQYQSQLDPTTGLLKSNLQTHWGPDINANTQGLEAIRARALGTGPSAWANAALQQQGLEESGLKNATQQQAASQGAMARSSLASKYGLSPAAQERLAKNQMRAQMSGLQNVGAQGAQARAQIGVQDEATKNQMLTQLPGMENANAQLAMQNRQGDLQSQQYNANNAIQANTMKNAADLEAWRTGMQGYAAGKSADAMSGSGGGKK